MPKDRDKLTREKIEAMWTVYRETGSVSAVASGCKVNWRTADRHRIKGQWDERREEILRQVGQKADQEYADWLASQRKVVDAAIAQVAKTVIPLPPEVKPTFMDLVSLIRLGSHLRGGADQRVEQNVKAEVIGGKDEKKRFKKIGELFTTDEIRQALARIGRKKRTQNA